MKKTFTTNSIRAALVVLLSSTATPRGFQETNTAAGNNHKGSAPHATQSAPARPSAPARTAPANSGGNASKGAPVSQAPNPASNANTNINKNVNINKNTNSNAGNQGSGLRQNGTGATSGFPGRGTDVRAPQGPVSNAGSNTNSNVNINKNININKNTNSRALNQSSGSRSQSGFSGGRGTDVRGPQGSTFNSNTNLNRNSNVYVNQYDGRHIGDSMVHNRAPHIEESHFRSNFGREHEFHFDQRVMAGARPGFRFGGVSFQVASAWPANWLYSDPVYVDFVGGSYVLCNRLHPGMQVPVNIGDCADCVQAPQMVANNADCPDCGAATAPADAGSVPTLARGQSMDQVVAILGTPKSIVDLGMKKIFLYNDMRVTFVGGRLSDFH